MLTISVLTNKALTKYDFSSYPLIQLSNAHGVQGSGFHPTHYRLRFEFLKIPILQSASIRR